MSSPDFILYIFILCCFHFSSLKPSKLKNKISLSQFLDLRMKEREREREKMLTFNHSSMKISVCNKMIEISIPYNNKKKSEKKNAH